MDLRATRPAVKLPQTSRRSGFNAWIGDERLCTFVLSGPGQPPRQSELQRLRALDAREPRPGEGPIEVPKVRIPSPVASASSDSEDERWASLSAYQKASPCISQEVVLLCYQKW